MRERGERPGARENAPAEESGQPDARQRLAVQKRAQARSQSLKAARAEAGEPLDDASRGRFEPLMQADLSSVRVHRGGAAREAAGELSARAFTVGSDIFMGEAGDDKLMAHELTHVVQQAGSAGAEPQRAPSGDAPVAGVSQPGDAAEREASSVAERVVAGERVSIEARPSEAIHREPKDGGTQEANAATLAEVRSEVERVGAGVHEVLDQARKKGPTAAQGGAESGQDVPGSLDELAGGGSLASALNVADFVGGILDMRPVWNDLDETGRLKSLEDLINRALGAVEVPNIQAAPWDNPNKHAFLLNNWQIQISQGLLGEGGKLDANEGEGIYHESRHAEQHFGMARRMAGKSLGAGEDAQRVIEELVKKDIPPEIAQKAVENPMKTDDPKGGRADNMIEQNEKDREKSSLHDPLDMALNRFQQWAEIYLQAAESGKDVATARKGFLQMARELRQELRTYSARFDEADGYNVGARVGATLEALDAAEGAAGK
jgi:Domain of unknown function (DUF4157)